VVLIVAGGIDGPFPRGGNASIRPPLNSSHSTIANLQSFSTENDSTPQAVAAGIIGAAAAMKAATAHFPGGNVDSFPI
jgi:hypothetical protein